MFRVKTVKGQQWVCTPHWQDGVGLSDHKKDAYIFSAGDRRYWKGEEYEIVPLAEDEVMVKLGAPRLPGF